MADIHPFPGGARERGPQPVGQVDGPFNGVVERGLLGALLLNPSHIPGLLGRIAPEHFGEQVHQLVYRAWTDMLAANRPMTLGALLTYLPPIEVAPGVSFQAYLARCAADDACIPAQIGAYADELLDLHSRRALVVVAQRIMESAVDPHPSHRCANMLDEAEAGLQGVRSSVIERTKTHAYAAETAQGVLDFLYEARDGHIAPTGTRTGLYKLDHATGGIQPGDLWIIGGRPGQGKTVTGTTLARGVAEQNVAAWLQNSAVRRKGAMFFSFEVKERQLTARLLADMAYLRSSPFQNPITFGDILRGRVTDQNHLWRIENAAKRLRDMPLALEWSSRLTVPQIGARIRAEKVRMARMGCDLSVVVLDYLKYIQASDRYRGQRAQEVAEISGGLKQLAKDEDIGVVLLAQLNRQNEMRGDPTPVLSDLKESGDLEADADVVAFVHRPEYYIAQTKAAKDQQPDAVAKLSAARGKMELILAKNRAGSTHTLNLFCDVGSSMIDDRDRRQTGATGNYVADDQIEGL